MGFIETKQKAAAFEKAQEHARAADLQNASAAAYTKGMNDAELRRAQQAYEHGLAMTQAMREQQVYNAKYGQPQNIVASTPNDMLTGAADEYAGYVVPTDKSNGPTSVRGYLEEEGGLASNYMRGRK